MTKNEATIKAIEFAKESITALNDSASDAKQAFYMKRFWEGFLAELQDLLSGEYLEEDCVAFTCYQTLKDYYPVGRDFLEAWGADIGRQGTAIHTFMSYLDENGLTPK